MPTIPAMGLIWRTAGVLYMTLTQTTPSRADLCRGNCATTLRECYEWFKECGAFDENDYQVTVKITDDPVVITSEDDWAVAFLTFADVR